MEQRPRPSAQHVLEQCAQYHRSSVREEGPRHDITDVTKSPMFFQWALVGSTFLGPKIGRHSLGSALDLQNESVWSVEMDRWCFQPWRRGSDWYRLVLAWRWVLGPWYSCYSWYSTWQWNTINKTMKSDEIRWTWVKCMTSEITWGLRTRLPANCSKLRIPHSSVPPVLNSWWRGLTDVKAGTWETDRMDIDMDTVDIAWQSTGRALVSIAGHSSDLLFNSHLLQVIQGEVLSSAGEIRKWLDLSCC